MRPHKLLLCLIFVLIAALQASAQTDPAKQDKSAQAAHAVVRGRVAGANPFIDPAGFKAYLDDKEKAFNTELAAPKVKQ